MYSRRGVLFIIITIIVVGVAVVLFSTREDYAATAEVVASEPNDGRAVNTTAT